MAGSKPRDVVQVKRVADVLGVTLDELVFGNGPPADTGVEVVRGNAWISGLFEVRLRRVRK